MCVFCLVNNKSVIDKPEPDPCGLGDELRALVLKSSIRRVATTVLRGDPMAVPFTCS